MHDYKGPQIRIYRELRFYDCGRKDFNLYIIKEEGIKNVAIT